MRKNLVLVLMVALMVAVFAGAGQATLIYANNVVPDYTTPGVINPLNLIGASNGSYAQFLDGGSAIVSFGTYFTNGTGADLRLGVKAWQTWIPQIDVSAHQAGTDSWVTLFQSVQVPSFGIRTYGFAGANGGLYDAIQLSFSKTMEHPFDTLFVDSVGVAFADASQTFNLSDLGPTNSGAPVPEPGTMMLLGSGLVGLAAYGRKKFRK